MSQIKEMHKFRKTRDEVESERAAIVNSNVISHVQKNYIQKSIPKHYWKLYFDLIAKNHNKKTKAIQAKCLDCCCYVREEITQCTVTTCPLYNMRPYQK